MIQHRFKPRTKIEGWYLFGFILLYSRERF